MSEKKRVIESSKTEKTMGAELPPERQCTHRFADGRQCRRRRWAGKEVCYQHDKEARAEKKLKEGSRQGPGFTVAQLQELLAMAMGQVLFGKMPVGQAYALGYLAQQSLAAHGAAAKDKKLDVKHFWEMVDLGATFERAAELAKERKRQKKEAEETKEEEEILTAEDAEYTEEDDQRKERARDRLAAEGASFVPQSPSASLPSASLGTGRTSGTQDEEAESFAPRGGAQDEEAEDEEGTDNFEPPGGVA